MAEYRRAFQQPDPMGASRWEMQGGDYFWYYPDRISGTSTALNADTRELLAEVDAAVGDLGAAFAAAPLPALYATLLRSESIASSRIEGVREDPAAVLLAGLDDADVTPSSAAVLINRNIDAVRQAVHTLAATPTWTVDDINALQAALLPAPQHGLRHVPVWISGSSPVRAKYVAPLPELVPELMADLASYFDTTDDPPLVQAAVSHAQLETIHPWVDGNGRAGRAMIQAVLGRTGLIANGVLPVSVVLGQRDSGYINALNAYRYDPRRGHSGPETREQFVKFFLQAARDAVIVGHDLLDQVQAVSMSWAEKTRHVRAHSAQRRLLALLTDRPVLTVSYAQAHTTYTDNAGSSREYSRVAIGNAFLELEKKGIVTRLRARDRGSVVYVAREIVDLLVLSERRLGSRDLDTRRSPVTKAARRRTPPLPENLQRRDAER